VLLKKKATPENMETKTGSGYCLGEIKTKDFGMRRSEPTSYYYYTQSERGFPARKS